MPAVAGAVLAGVGMVASFVASSKSAKAAKRAAQKEAHAENVVTAERLRQIGIEEKVYAGQTIAGYAGSNVNVQTGSPLVVLAEAAREFQYEKNVTREAGATKASMALQRGRDTATAYKYQSYANLAQGASNIFSILNQSGSKSTGTGTGP